MKAANRKLVTILVATGSEAIAMIGMVVVRDFNWRAIDPAVVKIRSG
jgi:hypothetical protein